MQHAKSLLLGLVLLAASVVPSARAEINVVASIKPVHSLVAAVMAGVGKPGLLVEGGGSPHTFAMKPSQAAMLERADLVFWIGHELEAFLERPLRTVASRAKSIALIEADGLVKLPLRDSGTFDAHVHHEHGPHRSDGSAHAGRHGAEKSHDDHDHERSTGAHGAHQLRAFNAHVWLDPINAKAMIRKIRRALADLDPANAAKYQANARAVMMRLDALTSDIAAELGPVKARGFIVFHDAYQNFENRFGLTALGSITVSPEVRPGARRVKRLRSKVRQLGATCVFSEPQFEPKLVATIVEGTSARSGVLDPLGAKLQDGPELYFVLLRNMASAFVNCLLNSN